MQYLNDEPDDPFYTQEKKIIEDLPTAEELWEALEASLEQSPWIPRAIPVGLTAASRDLARHWQEIENPTEKKSSVSSADAHYLERMALPQAFDETTPIEPDFLIDLAKFLLSRLAYRMQEVRQVQHQLVSELTKLQI